MGVAKYLKKTFQTRTNEQKKQQLVELRRQVATLRVANPTRLDRARALGYKAKQGYFLVRQRVKRGGHSRPSYRGGKSSGKMTSKLNLRVNYKAIAEGRVAKKYVNAEVLNSYFVAKDGKHAWYEVIMVDRSHPVILADDKISWIADAKGRTQRGLTSAGRKSRGLHKKGKGVEKARPSRRAHDRTL